MKKSVLTIFCLLIVQMSLMAQSGKDGGSRDGLYSYKEAPFEAIVTLLPVDDKTDQHRFCGLRYKYIDSQGKTVYVVYSPSDVPAKRAINMDEYLYTKVKLIGKSITFEIEMMQVAKRPNGINSCRQDAIYVVDIKPIQ